MECQNSIMQITDINSAITASKVLARILKMPVKNSNSKMSVRPYLATQLLKFFIPSTFKSLLCQKGNLHFRNVLEDDLLTH